MTLIQFNLILFSINLMFSFWGLVVKKNKEGWIMAFTGWLIAVIMQSVKVFEE